MLYLKKPENHVLPCLYFYREDIPSFVPIWKMKC